MKILFVTSELAGLVKVGGLADVSAALPRALEQVTGDEVRVLLPGYPGVLAGLREAAPVADLPGLAEIPPARLLGARGPDGHDLLVIDCPGLYDRPGTPYTDLAGRDWADNDIRFARLALAAAQLAHGLPGLDWQPDVMHVHDWPAALAPGYVAWNDGRQPVPTVTTIHNLAHQGLFPAGRLGALGVPEAGFAMEGAEFHGQLGFLKAGLWYASEVTTVSPSYADEITTPELGCGLHGLLGGLRDTGRLTGIVNGADDSWHPRDDPYLVRRFDLATRDEKQRNARAVRQRLGLAQRPAPLFSLIARMVWQKGVDLVIDACETLVRAGGQLVVMGTGDAALERRMHTLSHRHPGSVAVRIGYDEPVAHNLFAASDFFLMPSRFEPCGLTQMYAQRFGALPIAHRTGGLRDTIDDGVTGFLFPDSSVRSLLGAVRRALLTFNHRPGMGRMQREAMQREFGWDAPAREYHRVYARVHSRALAAGRTSACHE
ncbi:glycogen synthase GlgA [Derxia gummosa]|uniref:Glycogen synthase n=1 Tax=Derxia gummosa DSM 723 TaxID=1121388 RepID=A0A8B6X8H8_9BURK|nr:glycogen synthase GlgA [Derxia gummosa]